MTRFLLVASVFFLLTRPVVAAETPLAKQLKSLLAEYEDEGGPRLFSKRFLKLAQTDPKDPAAREALIWIIKNVQARQETTTALQLISKHHAAHKAIGALCQDIAAARSVAAEGLLRKIVKTNPDKSSQALACFSLASLLDQQASILEQLQAEPELGPRVLQYYGKDYGRHLSSLNAKQLTKKRESAYEQLARDYPKVAIRDGQMGDIASQALFAIRNLSIGCVAPDTSGQDISGKRLKLSDYRGKVVLLMFWGHW